MLHGLSLTAMEHQGWGERDNNDSSKMTTWVDCMCSVCSVLMDKVCLYCLDRQYCRNIVLARSFYHLAYIVTRLCWPGGKTF